MNIINRIKIFLGIKRKPKGWHLAQFFRQLSTLIKSGVTPIRSLEICYEQSSDLIIKERIQELINDLKTGSKLSQAFSEKSRNKVFTAFHAGAIKGYEFVGDISIVFENLADREEKEFKLREKVRSILTYPVLLSILSVIGIILLVKFLLPLVKSITEGQSIPWPTKFLIFFGRFLDRCDLFLMIFSLCIIIFVIIKKLFSIPVVNIMWDKFRYHIPVIGTILKTSMVVQVSNSLISLLDANLTFIATVELIGLTSESPYLKEKVFYPSADLMRKGESFSQSLKDQLVFPKSFHGMVVIGEETGTLTSMLKHIVTLHEIELELKIDQALKIIEPAILLVTGAMVLFVMLCTFLPLYSVLSGVLGTK